jgi:hypothetical protein
MARVMEIGLTVEIDDLDEDLINVCVSGCSGRFAGEANGYCSLDGLVTWADGLRGFPTHGADQREFEFTRSDDAGCWLCFRCIDDLGHAVVELRLATDPLMHHPESANLVIPVAAGAIDRFASELKRMGRSVGARATLVGGS